MMIIPDIQDREGRRRALLLLALRGAHLPAGEVTDAVRRLAPGCANRHMAWAQLSLAAARLAGTTDGLLGQVGPLGAILYVLVPEPPGRPDVEVEVDAAALAGLVHAPAAEVSV